MAHLRVDIYLDYGEKCAPCPRRGGFLVHSRPPEAVVNRRRPQTKIRRKLQMKNCRNEVTQ
jgi:hypothetical protein